MFSTRERVRPSGRTSRVISGEPYASSKVHLSVSR